MSLLSLPPKDEFTTTIRNTKAYLVFITRTSLNYPNHYTVIKNAREDKLPETLDQIIGKDAWTEFIPLGDCSGYREIGPLESLVNQLTVRDEKSRQYVPWSHMEKRALNTEPVQLAGLDKPRFNYDQIKQRYVSRYKVNVPWNYLETHLNGYREHYNLDLDPDFQRARVWNTAKQIAYVEFILSGGQTAKEIYFNCPGWQSATQVGQMTLVDGKQRMHAVRSFMTDQLEIFGGYKRSEILGRFDSQCDFIFYVNDLETRAQMLEWYLQINSGIAHTEQELEKVRVMLAEELKHGKLLDSDRGISATK